VALAGLSDKEEGEMGEKPTKGSSRDGRMLKKWSMTYPFSPLGDETGLIALHRVQKSLIDQLGARTADMQDVARHALEVPWAKESPERGKEAER
jgi:hypothetical protein